MCKRPSASDSDHQINPLRSASTCRSSLLVSTLVEGGGRAKNFKLRFDPNESPDCQPCWCWQISFLAILRNSVLYTPYIACLVRSCGREPWPITTPSLYDPSRAFAWWVRLTACSESEDVGNLGGDVLCRLRWQRVRGVQLIKLMMS